MFRTICIPRASNILDGFMFLCVREYLRQISSVFPWKLNISVPTLLRNYICKNLLVESSRSGIARVHKYYHTWEGKRHWNKGSSCLCYGHQISDSVSDSELRKWQQISSEARAGRSHGYICQVGLAMAPVTSSHSMQAWDTAEHRWASAIWER